MIRGILFDVDGTLIDNTELHVETWYEALAPHEEVSRERIRHQIGKGGDQLVPTVAPRLSPLEQTEVREAHRRLYLERIDRARPLPGAAELVREVQRRGLKVILASSSHAEEIERHLGILGLGQIPHTAAEDVAATKPAPDVFDTALQTLALTPDEALVIGDTPYDVEAAGRLGLRTVAVLSGGFSREELEKAGAIAVYQNAAALLADLDRVLTAD